MTERTRFTISVEPEVYEAFADLAHSSGVSLSRCIGDWLRDTAEAAQMTTIRVNEVRKSHQDIHREYVASQAREVEKIMRGEIGTSWGVGSMGGVGAAPRAGAKGLPEAPPRPVIRGGKSPIKGAKG
jgi:hypothetical protein